MPVETINLDHGLGVLMRGYGIVTGEEYWNTLQKHLSQDKEIIKKYRYTLADFTDLEQTRIETEVIVKATDLCKKTAIINPDVIVALAANQDLVFGLSRMWEMLATDTNWEINVFREIEEAKEWIQKRVIEKFGITNLTFS